MTRQPQGHPAEQTWAEWKAAIWDQLEAVIGYPGLCALEQYMWRSGSETRCVECGDPGTVSYPRTSVSLIKSVPVYYMCAECADYWAHKND